MYPYTVEGNAQQSKRAKPGAEPLWDQKFSFPVANPAVGRGANKAARPHGLNAQHLASHISSQPDEKEKHLLFQLQPGFR